MGLSFFFFFFVLWVVFIYFSFSGERVLEIFKGGGGAYGSSSIMGICHYMLNVKRKTEYEVF